MSQALPSTSGPRSGAVIWALILIAAGVIWLLRELDIFTAQNMAVLLRLWPLILIAIGVELLIGRGSRAASTFIVGATIIVLVLLMFVGPSLGLAPNVEIKSLSLNEPVGEAASARMNLGVGVGNASVAALSDSSSLIEADLRYVGDVRFDVTPGAQTVVTLNHEQTASTPGFDFFGWTLALDPSDLHWNILLTPAIPIDLTFNGGVGTSRVDLSGLQITRLAINTGVGDSVVTLPDSEGMIPVRVNGGVGRTTLTIPEGAALNADINAGVGDTTIDVPNDAAVRIQIEGGLGGVNLPSSWQRVSGEERSGVWESPTYDTAASGDRIEIDYNGGVGGLRVD
ncbi:MAG: hypothetical protein JNL42_05995 [Anaerolineae bacterium]|nr:hypothetical protein [Anaerolineae bacterium]